MKHDDGRFRHDLCIAGAADRALMGPRQKQQLWALPEGLTEVYHPKVYERKVYEPKVYESKKFQGIQAKGIRILK